MNNYVSFTSKDGTHTVVNLTLDNLLYIKSEEDDSIEDGGIVLVAIKYNNVVIETIVYYGTIIECRCMITQINQHLGIDPTHLRVLQEAEGTKVVPLRQ